MNTKHFNSYQNKKQTFKSHIKKKKYFCDLPSHSLVLPLWEYSSSVSPLPHDPVQWVSSGEYGLFQGHASWVIYGLLSARQRLLLGKSRRGATTSIFSPGPMVSGLSAPGLKLCARHPSCWSGSHRDSVGHEPQLDVHRAAVSAAWICSGPEDDRRHHLASHAFYCPDAAHKMDFRVNFSPPVSVSLPLLFFTMLFNHAIRHWASLRKTWELRSLRTSQWISAIYWK